MNSNELEPHLCRILQLSTCSRCQRDVSVYFLISMLARDLDFVLNFTFTAPVKSLDTLTHLCHWLSVSKLLNSTALNRVWKLGCRRLDFYITDYCALKNEVQELCGDTGSQWWAMIFKREWILIHKCSYGSRKRCILQNNVAESWFCISFRLSINTNRNAVWLWGEKDSCSPKIPNSCTQHNLLWKH